jgi:GNAT superfamily N-acetyltransferase
MKTNYQIEALKREEIPELKNFAPADWNFDLPAFLLQHFGKDYFFAFTAKSEGRIVATGNGIFTGKAGWAGNIIVDEKFRLRGIGTAITKTIADEFIRRNCRSILLIATSSGMPVYYKLGFKTSLKYSFYKCPLLLDWQDEGYIRKIRKTDFEKILAIDKFCTGEDRKLLLSNFISKGYVFDKNGIQGFYLPDFGAGFIAAESSESGLSLLRFKLSKPGQIVVIPEENFAASGFLEQMGCIETNIAPRMFLGQETDWHPEMIYSRAAGYCG